MTKIVELLKQHYEKFLSITLLLLMIRWSYLFSCQLDHPIVDELVAVEHGVDGFWNWPSPLYYAWYSLLSFLTQSSDVFFLYKINVSILLTGVALGTSFFLGKYSSLIQAASCSFIFISSAIHSHSIRWVNHFALLLFITTILIGEQIKRENARWWFWIAAPLLISLARPEYVSVSAAAGFYYFVSLYQKKKSSGVKVAIFYIPFLVAFVLLHPIDLLSLVRVSFESFMLSNDISAEVTESYMIMTHLIFFKISQVLNPLVSFITPFVSVGGGWSLVFCAIYVYISKPTVGLKAGPLFYLKSIYLPLVIVIVFALMLIPFENHYLLVIVWGIYLTLLGKTQRRSVLLDHALLVALVFMLLFSYEIPLLRYKSSWIHFEEDKLEYNKRAMNYIRCIEKSNRDNRGLEIMTTRYLGKKFSSRARVSVVGSSETISREFLDRFDLLFINDIYFFSYDRKQVLDFDQSGDSALDYLKIPYGKNGRIYVRRSLKEENADCRF